MKEKKYKQLKTLLSTSLGLLSLFLSKSLYAQGYLSGTTDLSKVAQIISNVIEIFAGLIGIVFIIMIFISAIKFALSQGDPKGIQGAKEALTLAVIGFLVVAGAFVVARIIGSFAGTEESLITSPIGKLRTGIEEFIAKINECNEHPIGCLWLWNPD